MSAPVSVRTILGIVLLTLPSIVGAVPAAVSPLPSASHSLSSASAIQVRETFLKTDKDGKMTSASVEVTIVRPNKIKLVVTSASGSKPDEYLSDGVSEYEYNAQENTYTTNLLPADGKSHSKMRSMYAVDFILNNGVLPGGKDLESVASSETVDGKAMAAASRSLTIKTPDGAPLEIVAKAWTDTSDSLPYRFAASVTSKGVTHQVYEATFSNWRLNKPISTDQFAWAPPGDAKQVQK